MLTEIVFSKKEAFPPQNLPDQRTLENSAQHGAVFGNVLMCLAYLNSGCCSTGLADVFDAVVNGQSY